MSIADCAYLLGQAHALVKQCRAHMIRKQDIEGVELIEDQFQELEEGIKKFYYKNMEKEHGSKQRD